MMTAMKPVVMLAFCLLCAGCFGGESFRANTTPKTSWVAQAAYSPDGELIAIDFSSAKFNGLLLITNTGRALRQLCAGGPWESCRYPAFSPDGQRVAFARQAGGQSDLYIVNRGGGGLRRLTNSPMHNAYPVFSEDGKRLYFVRQRRGSQGEGTDYVDGDIHFIDLEDGSERQVTNDRLRGLGKLCMLPGGDYALVTTKSPILTTRGTTLWKVDLRDPARKWPLSPGLNDTASSPGEKAKAGTPSPLEIHDPVISRDGRWLAFSWRKPGGQPSAEDPQIYVMDMQTGRADRKTFIKGWHPIPQAFSPDGLTIIFTSFHLPPDPGNDVFVITNLWRVQRNGTGLRNIPLDFRGLAGQGASVPSK